MGRQRDLSKFPPEWRDKPIPAGVRWQYGQARWEDAKGQIGPVRASYPLGAEFGRAMLCLDELLQEQGRTEYMRQVFTRFVREYAPTKRPDTRRSYEEHIFGPLMTAFGHFRPREVTDAVVVEYMEWRAPLKANRDASRDPYLRHNQVHTNREVRTLSVVFSVLIKRWRYPMEHPIIGKVEEFDEFSRDVQVHPAAYWAIYEAADEVTRLRMEIHAMLGFGSTDVRYLDRAHIKPEGIRYERRKTSTDINVKGYRAKGQVQPNTYLFNPDEPELASLVLRLYARQDRLGVRVEPLLCTRTGARYTKGGLDALWKRAVKRAIAAGTLNPDARFQPRDIRAWAGTQAENVVPFGRPKGELSAGATLLQHSSQRIFEQHYRRAPKSVQPVRLPPRITPHIVAEREEDLLARLRQMASSDDAAESKES